MTLAELYNAVVDLYNLIMGTLGFKRTITSGTALPTGNVNSPIGTDYDHLDGGGAVINTYRKVGPTINDWLLLEDNNVFDLIVITDNVFTLDASHYGKTLSIEPTLLQAVSIIVPEALISIINNKKFACELVSRTDQLITISPEDIGVELEGLEGALGNWELTTSGQWVAIGYYGVVATKNRYLVLNGTLATV